jgi:hypothetical protein
LPRTVQRRCEDGGQRRCGSRRRCPRGCSSTRAHRRRAAACTGAGSLGSSGGGHTHRCPPLRCLRRVRQQPYNLGGPGRCGATDLKREREREREQAQYDMLLCALLRVS